MAGQKENFQFSFVRIIIRNNNCMLNRQLVVVSIKAMKNAGTNLLNFRKLSVEIITKTSGIPFGTLFSFSE
jgi:hypothetical protein